jgi:predicted MFS family arabinose efflux permease
MNVASGSAARESERISAYTWYVVVLMAVVNVLAYVDRYIIATLLVPIQNDLQVSDTAMGLLTGLAFTLFYALAAVPIARIADHGNRRNLLAIAVVVWSAATALCGAATNYLQLLVARIGVAAGESAGTPAILSMISDLFRPNRRATAVGIYFVGASVGVFVGSYLGGLLNDLYGWRTAFVVMGLPGIAVGLLIYMTVREPVRGGFEGGVDPSAEKPSLVETIRFLFGIRTFRTLTLGCALFGVANASWLIWAPALLMRVHNLSTTEMGLGVGAFTAIGGIIGNVVSGRLSDRLAQAGVRRYLQFICGVSLATIPLVVIYLFMPTAIWAMAMLLPLALVSSCFYAPSIAASLAIVPPQTRGTMAAVFGLCLNLIGGLGPVLIGFLSDQLSGYGDYALRYALLVLPLIYLAAAVYFYLGSRTIEADAERAAVRS